MIKVLFLCTGNSCRSQMAEGYTRHLHGKRIAAHSAGVAPNRLDPRAVRVMSETGIDISGQRAKHVDEVAAIEFDWVVTVCGHADEHCPSFPGTTRVVHVGFDDPPALARAEIDEERALDHYRRVRDEIRAFVAGLPHSLESLSPRSGEEAS